MIFCFLVAGLPSFCRAELSEKTRAAITASFPHYTPHTIDKTPQVAPAGPSPLSDDPLVHLPDYLVKEKGWTGADPDLWLSRRAKADKTLLEYHGSMTDLEWALNWWHIPLPFGYSLTPSAQARANAIDSEKKILRDQKQIKSFAAAIASVDSTEAKKLLHDLDLSGHPGR